MCYYNILTAVLIHFFISETASFSIKLTIDVEPETIVKQVLKSLNEEDNLNSTTCGPTNMPDFSSFATRISEQKCMEYVFEMLQRQERRHLGCPVPNDLGIIHGKKTKPAEYPHMGALGWRNRETRELKFLCGASLISEKFMITAGHCTFYDSRGLLEDQPSVARLGSRYIEESPSEGYQDVPILRPIIDPKYDPQTHYYDIALIELRMIVTFSKYIQPACLITREYDIRSKKHLTVTGWGQPARGTRNSKKLLYAEISIYTHEDCSKYYDKYNYNIKSNQMCAGDKNGEMDTCDGDSGGPLQYMLVNTTLEGTIHRIISITSFGLTDCATKDAPGIYVKVSSFIDWIEKTVWPSW